MSTTTICQLTREQGAQIILDKLWLQRKDLTKMSREEIFEMVWQYRLHELQTNYNYDSHDVTNELIKTKIKMRRNLVKNESAESWGQDITN